MALTVPILHAQLNRGEISGTVMDPQGAVVPGATVTVTNVETGVALTLASNSAGLYRATALVPGTYNVRVQSKGFQPLEITKVQVTAGSTTGVDAHVKLGTTTQTVEVTAGAPLIEETPSNFNVATLQSRTINELPLVGRDIQTMVQLMPGITQSTGPSGSVFGFNSQFGGFPDPQHLVGSGISANGSQGGANAWYLDGSLNAALGAENVVVNPSPDAVSEFSVIDNGLAPEWGRTSGAIVNVVLKSGTNQLHGDIYEYNRNSHFSATNPFARRDSQGRPLLNPRVNFNDFGGTLGGPVYIPHVYNGKNRTFFFFSYDVSLLHENINRILTVPLPNEKNGNFTGDPRFASVCDPAAGVTNCLYNPYSTTGPDANGQFHRTPFTNPIIPPGMVDPLAAYYLSSYPNPNFVDPLQQGPGGCGDVCNNYIGGVGSSQTTQNVSVKIDHNISAKEQFFAEWLFNPSFYTNFKYPWTGATAQTQTGVAGAQPYRTANNIGTLGLTSTLSSTLVNEARFTFSRQSQRAQPNPDSLVDTGGVAQRVQGLNYVLFPPFQEVPDIGIGDVGSFGPQQWQNAIQGVQAVTFIDNVTKILGKHTLKGGLMFRKDYNWNEAAWGYGLGFGGGLTSDPVTGQGGSGLAQFLLGAVDTGSGTGTYHPPWQINDYWGFYGQDTWKVTNKLSITYGLRWDVNGWFREKHNLLANIDYNSPNPEISGYNGRIDYVATPIHPGRDVFPANTNSLGPRFSFAWAPNKKTVVRGGFGIIYSNGISAAMGDQNGAISGPAAATYIAYNGDFTGERPAFRMSSGAPTLIIPNSSVPLTGSTFGNFVSLARQQDLQFLGTGVQGFLKGSKDPYVEQWNFQIQRELPGGVSLSLGYVGTHGMHLFGDEFRSYDHVPTAVRQTLRDNINNPVPTDPAIGAIYGCGTSCPAFLVDRPFPQYTDLEANSNPDGFNRYNSLQVRVEKHYSHGLNFIAAYTYQKNIQSANTGSIIGNSATPTTLGRTIGRASFVPGAISGGVANGASGQGGTSVEENPDDRRRYVALAPDDIPQILNIAGSYDLPFGKGRAFMSTSRPLNWLVGGWTLTQNWNFQSGVPMFFTGPCNGISCRPNLVGNPSSGRSGESRQQQENQWFNPSAFAPVFGSDPSVIQAVSTGLNPDGSAFNYNTFDPWWTFGNIGLRPPSGRAPGYWNADVNLSKNFHLTESRYLQFRWTLFNAFNHQNLGLPNTNYCLPPGPNGQTDLVHQFGCQFGKITNVQTDPRSMEFAMKFYF
jgi:Carboxypeptidase regulatory-like domain